MKRRKKHSYKRRHRMSGLGAVGSFTPELGAVLGGATGGFVNKILPSTLNPKLVAGSKIVLGGVIRRTFKGDLASGIGLGMVALGTYELLQQLGVLSGIGAPADSDMIAVSLDGIGQDGTTTVLAGADDLSVINGSGDLSVINGTETILAGDEEDGFMGETDEFEAF